MLYKLHTNIFIVGLLTFGFMAVKVYDRAFSVMTLGSVIAFITQLGLLIYFSREDEVSYSGKNLFKTVLIYSTIMCAILMGISYYYDGDTFMFSKSDAIWYYEQSTKFASLGLVDGFKYMIHNCDNDDWGALLIDGFLMYLIPSKYLLNAVYLPIGAGSAVLLFKIGKFFMPESYSFLGALGFSTSSFMLFFHCSYLKESVFVFFVICAIYFLYQFIFNQSRAALIAVLLFTIILLFFRPAVSAMIIVSIIVYYGISQRRNAITVFLYGAALLGFVVALKSIQEIIDYNTAGGDFDAVIADTNNASYSTSFNYFVSFFAAFFGPFPTLFNPADAPPTSMSFLGAGLSYRLFLILPFWYGVYMSYKKQTIEFIPLIVFIFFEMLATGAVCASLELRKVLPHIPLMFIFSYFGLYCWAKTTHSTRLYEWFNFAYAVGILLLWNVIRVKTSYE